MVSSCVTHDVSCVYFYEEKMNTVHLLVLLKWPSVEVRCSIYEGGCKGSLMIKFLNEPVEIPIMLSKGEAVCEL